MKIFRTKLNSSFAILITLGTLSVWAKPIAQVQEVKGVAFVITPSGTTKKINSLDIIDERAEVLVEEGAQISLNDYYNVTYHLTGGTHIKFYDRSIQLKKGKTWVKSQSKNPLAMTTGNGNVEYSASQFIATFDQVTNRSQILVVQGEVEVSNILDKNLRYTVNQGDFTVIDSEVDSGLPRAPTKVGIASLNSALEEFKMNGDQTPLPQMSKPSRGIASVAAKKGEIIFISSTALPREVGNNPKRTPASVVTSPKSVSGETSVSISYYGLSKETQKVSRKFRRLPASSAKSQIEVEPTLKRTLKVQGTSPVYSNDLESLILELKSY